MTEATLRMHTVDMHGPRTYHNRELISRYIQGLIHHFDRYAQHHTAASSMTNVLFTVRQSSKGNDDKYTIAFIPNITVGKVAAITDKLPTDDTLTCIVHDYEKNEITISVTLSSYRKESKCSVTSKP